MKIDAASNAAVTIDFRRIQLGQLNGEFAELREHWQEEKAAIGRIRQIRERAFEKLRESPDGRALAGFWGAA